MRESKPCQRRSAISNVCNSKYCNYKPSCIVTMLCLVCSILSPPQSYAFQTNRDNEKIVNGAAIQSIIEQSKTKKGWLQTLRKNLGIFIVHKNPIDPESTGKFNKIVSLQIQNFGRLLDLNMVYNKIFDLDPQHSELVIFRTITDVDVERLGKLIPNAKTFIDNFRRDLDPKTCLYFFSYDRANEDEIETAYLYVGLEVPDAAAASCLSSMFMLSFGVGPSSDQTLSRGERSFSEMAALRAIDLCSGKHRSERITCVAKKISEIAR
jgi:hypothetical protein